MGEREVGWFCINKDHRDYGASVENCSDCVIADLRAKLEQAEAVIMTGTDAIRRQVEFAGELQARARRLEEALRGVIDMHNAECPAGGNCVQYAEARAALAPENPRPRPEEPS